MGTNKDLTAQQCRDRASNRGAVKPVVEQEVHGFSPTLGRALHTWAEVGSMKNSGQSLCPLNP